MEKKLILNAKPVSHDEAVYTATNENWMEYEYEKDISSFFDEDRKLVKVIGGGFIFDRYFVDRGTVFTREAFHVDNETKIIPGASENENAVSQKVDDENSKCLKKQSPMEVTFNGLDFFEDSTDEAVKTAAKYDWMF